MQGEWRESLMEAVSELDMKSEEKEENTELSLAQVKNKKNIEKREFDGKVGLVHLRKQFKSFRSLVETIGGEHFFQPTWIEFEPPAIKLALEHFLSGTTEQRDHLEILVGVWTGM